jgi:hypothetical protein
MLQVKLKSQQPLKILSVKYNKYSDVESSIYLINRVYNISGHYSKELRPQSEDLYK